MFLQFLPKRFDWSSSNTDMKYELLVWLESKSWIFLEGLWIQQINNSIGGVKYHKKCMKCASCNRKLDSRSFCIDKKEIYCTVCLKKNRLAGQDTPKIHPDTTVIATAEGEKGCPRYPYYFKRSTIYLVF